MDTRVHDQNLEINVLQALFHYERDVSRNIVVTATPDGLVWLRGMVPGQANRLRILRIVGEVPGVTQVFFNIALKA
jgi:osmotically-inducible protein OsmY